MKVRAGWVGAAALVIGVSAAALSGCNRNEAAQPSRTQVGDRAAPLPASSGSTGGGYSDSGRSDRGSYGGDRGGGYDRGGSGGGRYDRGGPSYDRDNRADVRPREAIPDFNGKPMWSDNRRHTAQENAQYHFEHDGPDLGAKTLKDYLTQVHDFVDHPPSGAETLTRPNGDRLIYDPKTNLFAVARKDGAPRTAFKPRAGAEYWKQQQARAQDEGGGGGYRRSSRADRDEG